MQPTARWSRPPRTRSSNTSSPRCCTGARWPVATWANWSPLALRLGLMQRTLKPQFTDPQLLIFAADHGVAVEGLVPDGAHARAAWAT